MRVITKGKTALLSPKEKLRRLHRNIFIFIIVAGIMNISFPLVAHADIFNNDVQDVYATITENVDETNEILKSAFRFTQVSPYSIVNSVGGAAGGIGVAIRTATKNLALIVSVLLLMVEFFRKTTNFEWSSKWENILIFLVKLIVVKQVVQNADLIIEYIYKGFNTINTAATSCNMDFLPAGHKVTYSISIQESLLHDVVQADHWYQGWIRYWEHVGAGETRHAFTYTISQDAVKMFYPHAVFPSSTNVMFEDHAFGNPTTALTFNPTIEIILWQPYFLAMKAIAYMIFVVTIGRIFELAVYTIFAPLPIATFASDTTHDVAKSFIKNYIATVIQIAVIVVMFIVYLAVAQYFANHTSGLSSLKLLSFFSAIMGDAEITPIQKTIIDSVMHRAYEHHAKPTLREYYDELQKYEQEASEETRPAAAYLRQTLHLYVHGSMNVFAHETNVNIHKRIVAYDIKELGKNMQTLSMMIVLENIWDRVAKNRAKGVKTQIFCDELYLLFKSEQSANFFYELYKRARKWGGVPCGITQNVDDLLRSELARTMISNTQFVVMLGQNETDREQLANLLHIPKETMDTYLNGVGAGCGMIYAGDYGLIPFDNSFPNNTDIYRIITTKFGEVQKAVTVHAEDQPA